MYARQAARRPCSIGWLRLKAEVTWMPDRPRADPAASGGSALRRKSQRDPVTPAVQVVHRLHGEQHQEILLGAILGTAEAQVELVGALQHRLQHLVDRV